jgi:hypothetical protein
MNEDSNIIWRYMDFTKFVSLLDRSALFFARADKFKDQFEGSWTKKNFERMTTAFKGVDVLDGECHDIVDGKMCHHIVDKVL